MRDKVGGSVWQTVRGEATHTPYLVMTPATRRGRHRHRTILLIFTLYYTNTLYTALEDGRLISTIIMTNNHGDQNQIWYQLFVISNFKLLLTHNVCMYLPLIKSYLSHQ